MNSNMITKMDMDMQYCKSGMSLLYGTQEEKKRMAFKIVEENSIVRFWKVKKKGIIMMRQSILSS